MSSLQMLCRSLQGLFEFSPLLLFVYNSWGMLDGMLYTFAFPFVIIKQLHQNSPVKSIFNNFFFPIRNRISDAFLGF